MLKYQSMKKVVKAELVYKLAFHLENYIYY